MAKLKLIKLVLCGPGDVPRERDIACRAIEDWNRLHGENRGVTIQCQHWSTDTYPDARASGQGAVNRQIIDTAHMLVAIFWTRLGTPTVAAMSGTVEEIDRGIARGKYVMIYFSDLESTSRDVDTTQQERLWEFRQSIRNRASCSTFQSRNQFKESFTNHLALALNTLLRTRPGRGTSTKNSPVVRQVSNGSGNVQITGDGNQVNNFQRPPTIKTVIERRPGSVTPAEEHRIKEWIEDLAEGTVGKERRAAYSAWGAHFLERFQVEKRGSLPSSRIHEVEQWHREQKAMQIEGYKTKAPDRWRNARITAIKAAMRQMKRTNEDYYPEIAKRLRITRAFHSLKGVTKVDLDRIYRLVRNDCASYRP